MIIVFENVNQAIDEVSQIFKKIFLDNKNPKLRIKENEWWSKKNIPPSHQKK
jgi:hypothetical protein